LEVLAERKPIQIVTATVTSEKARIQGSKAASMGFNLEGRKTGNGED
jgi:hypothetical protein